MTAAEAQDREAREAAVESSDRSMLVEAAAGTGKTTLLVSRILHGLRARRFTLPQSVVITFTEKAAGELERRLRAELAGQLRAGDLSLDERRSIEEALAEIDLAAIGTIHSFCASLLRERPVEAGVDPEFDVLDQAQADMLREDCWARWAGQEARACRPPLMSALAAGIGAGDEGHASGLKTLADALVRFPEALDRSAFELARPARSAEQILQELQEAAPGAARFISENLRGNGNEQSRLLRRQVERLLAAPADSPARLSAACSLAGVELGKAITSFPKQSREGAGEVLGALLSQARQASAHLACDVLEWMGEFLAFYQREKRQRSALDFQDLLLLSARMLRTDTGVRRRLQRCFRAFFVDEFQDTDPLQAEVIAFLCEKEGTGPADRLEKVRLDEGKLFVVGDPKQSIYRFRRADVEVYEQFKDLYRRLAPEGEVIRKVFRNFRSTPSLIAALNPLFERVLEAPEQSGVYQAQHVALIPAADGPAVGPGIVAVCPCDEVAGQLSDAAAARALEARHLAGVVRQLVEGPLPDGFGGRALGRELNYGSFACLLRALTDVDVYEEGFERLGVPYRVLGGRDYYQRQEIGETLAVLRAVDDPLDQVSVVAALRSSYFGVSDEELVRYRESGGLWDYLSTGVLEGPAGEAMHLLREWHRRRKQLAPQVLLRGILDRTKAVEAFMLKPAGPQRAANVHKLLGQLRSLWEAGAGTFRSAVDYLADLHEREQAEEESSMLEPGDEFVSIMSIHKAKGLEFDVVCLPDLARIFKGAGGIGPLVLDRIGRQVAVRVGKNARSCRYDELAEREQASVLEEQKRLLYVAATRARLLLVLPLHWHRQARKPPPSMLELLLGTGRFEGPDGVPFGRQRNGVFYWDTRQERQGAEPATPAPAPGAGDDDGVADMLAQRRRWRAEHERLALRTAAGLRIVAPSAFEGGPAPLDEQDVGTPGGRELGSLFHEIMRLMPLPVSDPLEGLERTAALLAATQAAAAGLDDDSAGQAARLVISLMENAEFLALLRGARQVRQEAPFAVPLRELPFCDAGQEGLLEGSIDLLLTAGGRTTVVDYKTDRLDKGSLQEAARRYWPQLALYGLAAQACGWAQDAPELVLCFARQGRLVRRRLDAGLLAQAQDRVETVLSAPARRPSARAEEDQEQA